MKIDQGQIRPKVLSLASIKSVAIFLGHPVQRKRTESKEVVSVLASEVYTKSTKTNSRPVTSIMVIIVSPCVLQPFCKYG